MGVQVQLSASVLRPCVFALAILSGCISNATAGTYDSAVNNGVNWLIAQSNSQDGSWFKNFYGRSQDGLRYVQTSDAVTALGVLNRRVPQYYAGLAWLENHVPTNLDFQARRVIALAPAGGATAADVMAIQVAQALSSISSIGNNGWGTVAGLQGAVLDTALALQALNQVNATSNVSVAVTYLLGAQLTAGSDTGWAMGRETVSEPALTAQVILALVPLQPTNSAIGPAITKGLASLNAKVTSSSSVQVIALAAMANLRNNATSSQGLTQLSWLLAQQDVGGSWSNFSIDETAVALRALALGMGRDLVSQRQVVSVPDANLRAAVNAALGRSAMDAVTAGELLELTSLSASGKSIRDLTGLQYATNLTYLDVSNNDISSFAPVAGLTNTQIVKTGQDTALGGNGDTADAPTLPQWGAIFLFVSLLLVMSRSNRLGKSSASGRRNK